MKQFVVVAKSRASAIFYNGENLRISYVREGADPVTLLFRTRFEQIEGCDLPVPSDLWLEASGLAQDIHEAGEIFMNAASDMSSIIALVCKASMGMLEPELLFDVSSDTQDHEFMQSFVPEMPITAVPGRKIDTELVSATLGALASNPEKERIQRAIVHYADALQSWRFGHEVTCLARLYMGVEALTKATLRIHLRRLNLSEDALVALWRIDKKELDSQVRLRLIFQGNANCFRKARSVSDGFEHGFARFAELYKSSREVTLETANYLRSSILDATGITGTTKDQILGAAYKRPRGPALLVRYVRGTLIGDASKLAAEGQAYPFFHWTSKLKSVRIGDDGKYSFTPEENLTARLGSGVKFKPSRHEVWDGGVISGINQPLNTDKEE